MTEFNVALADARARYKAALLAYQQTAIVLEDAKTEVQAAREALKNALLREED